MTLNNLTEKSEEARLLYGNVCVFLLKKAKNKYFEKLNLHNVTGTNKFWKTVNQHSESNSKHVTLAL